ncbi:hypothetical protein E4T80_12490 [Muribacter muris]|uniref:VENN motif-containing domain-containing protein n=2 Tax=Muribacter muris TaxID=67855 RepID=A0A4Y9JR92_9PAST|nr:hypothetical protein E4T80_12490 [Muribacter muris]
MLSAVEFQLTGRSPSLGALAGIVAESSAEILSRVVFGKSPNELTEGEKQQVVALSQVASALATTVAGGNGETAASAMASAKSAVEHNYLSTAQQAQYQKELAECKDLACKVKTKAYWNAVDIGQDASFATGIIAGVPESLYDTVSGILDMAMSPLETLDALKTMFSQDNAFSKITDSVKQSYIEQIDRLKTEYEKAGVSGSFNAGRETGKLLADIATVATGLGGVAKGSIKVGGEAITKGMAMAKKVPQAVGNQINRGVNKNLLKTMALQSDTAVATQSGHISKAQIEKYGEVLKPTNQREWDLMDKITQVGDPTGKLTEELMNSVAARSGFKPVKGGTYGANGKHGFDHVLVYEKEGIPLIIDSKQISKQGTIQVSTKAAGKTHQLSEEWIEAVKEQIGKNGETHRILEHAKDKNIPVRTAIVGVDKTTGEIKLIPVKVPNKIER